ncbi:FMN-binding protein [Microbacterium bovistercoris]|uniref:FMN-binding protein n=1 Tax=Microbacterium bovistercoris TaxID=2293570 RepID=A0A371NQ75_9MICO|nr:FMN-binding protein [Microbacterium bovistercoris]REJ04300.1 FMN-binding protein [Microbacterium bovistercoris]
MTSHATRTVTALAGAAGVLLLAGCSGAADAESGDSAAPAEYTDGTYTAEGSYQTPETVEQVSVTLTLTDGVVSDVEVTGDPQASETEQYQGQFIGGIAAEVEGKNIDELEVDRVAGSSLTSGGFNQAVEKIKEQAQTAE